MKTYEVLTDTPDLLILAQSDTRHYIASIFGFGFLGITVSIGFAFYFRAQPLTAVLVAAIVIAAAFLFPLWLFQGKAAIKVDKATRAVTTLYLKWLPPFERIEYLIPFDKILHAGVYPSADMKERSTILGMETEEGIIKLVPSPGKSGEELLAKLLAKVMAIADHLATVDPKASQQGREPGHVVTAVEYAPTFEATGTERGSIGFDDVRQDLLGRVDRLLSTVREGGAGRGEGREPVKQDMLEALRAVERKILALDAKVSGFAVSAHAALLHALASYLKVNDRRVPGTLARARDNLLRA